MMNFSISALSMVDDATPNASTGPLPTATVQPPQNEDRR